MSGTIIDLTPKFTKWAFLFNGITNTAIGLNIVLQAETLKHWASILALLLIIAGPLLLVYGIILFFPRNRFSPTIEINKEVLSLKTDFAQKRSVINWSNVTEITYRSFQIEFMLQNDEVIKIPLQTNASISIKIKKALREYAGINQVQVVGG